MDGLAGRYRGESGDQARRSAGAGASSRPVAECDEDARRSRAPYPDWAAPQGRAGYARGSIAPVQYFAGESSADRGPRVREATEIDQVRRPRTAPAAGLVSKSS